MKYAIIISFLNTVKFDFDSDCVNHTEKATFELTKCTSFLYKNRYIYLTEHVRWLVPINSTQNYFECKIISKGETGRGIWIGVGPFPEEGFYYNVATYRIDNGHLHHGDACGDRDCEKCVVQCMSNMTFSEGDRIGCGIIFDDDPHSEYVYVFFTKNGIQFGHLTKCKKPHFDLCPVMGMEEEHEKICFLQLCNRPSLLSVSEVFNVRFKISKEMSCKVTVNCHGRIICSVFNRTNIMWCNGKLLNLHQFSHA